MKNEYIKKILKSSEKNLTEGNKNLCITSFDNSNKNQMLIKKNKLIQKNDEEKIVDLDIKSFNPTKEAAKKLKNSKIIINCSIEAKITRKKPKLNIKSNMKCEYTQTEEIFYKLEWTAFIGHYKILSCNKIERILVNKNDNNKVNHSSIISKKKRVFPNHRGNSFNNKIFINCNNNNKNAIFVLNLNKNFNIINDNNRYSILQDEEKNNNIMTRNNKLTPKSNSINKFSKFISV